MSPKISLSHESGIDLRYANRHGLVTGVTGSGKTVTLQKLIEGFSAAGVPVFATDVKGDLSGVAAEKGGKSFPVAFWDLFGEDGLPIKTSIDEMGPLVLSRLLDLNQVQEGILNIAYRWPKDEGSYFDGIRMMNLDCLRYVVSEMPDRADTIRLKHGNVTGASVGAIQRAMLVLEGQGGDNLFGEPHLRVEDFMRVDGDGRGFINLLSGDRLMDSPRLYGAFLLWLLLKLFEVLPEAGDLDKPKLVFFFDEAHLLFADASPTLLETIERVVRLIRSKGVGIYFVTQHPLDVPPTILSQLGNRVQHALRAFTPRDRKAVKTAAETFRQNPAFNTLEAITQLAVGEALVSFLGDGGVPSMVERIRVVMPSAQVGPIDPEERYRIIRADPLSDRYGKSFETRDDEFTAFYQRITAKDADAAARSSKRGWKRSPRAGELAA